MSTSRDRTKSSRRLQVHIVDVLQRKEGGCTVVVRLPPKAEIPSEDIWRTGISKEYQGAIQVGRLWHLYYGQVPTHSPGDWVELALPDEPRKGSDILIP